MSECQEENVQKTTARKLVPSPDRYCRMSNHFPVQITIIPNRYRINPHQLRFDYPDLMAKKSSCSTAFCRREQFPLPYEPSESHRTRNFSFITHQNHISDMIYMQEKKLFQKKIGLGMTLSVELLNALDQSRGQVPRSAAVETILRRHLNLAARGQIKEISK